MAHERLGPAERRRRRRDIARRLEDFPRQHAALEQAMAAFGDDFELRAFKAAFETTTDMAAYNRVQAVERALGRVQGYVADLATDGVVLVGLPTDGMHGSAAQRAFEALRAAGVLSTALCRRLERAQAARNRIEHVYVDASAGDVHRAAELVSASSREFIARYTPWVDPQLGDGRGASRQP